jgi:hypothetical protein
MAQAYVRFAREEPEVFAMTMMPYTPEVKVK